MDGSDDYFGDDDFVLDENTLAVLDLEEQKWQQQRSQLQSTAQRRPLSQDAPLPQPKKQKTSHESTPDGLIPRIRAVAVGEDYDEDLPDISIVGDGSYKLPAGQLASADELVAHMRVSSALTNGASTSARPPVRAPPPPKNVPPVRPPIPPHPRQPSNGNSGQSHAPSHAAGPSNKNRLPRQSTLSSIQAALADFVPSVPPAPAPTPPNSRPSRASPAPGPSRLSPGVSVPSRGFNAPSNASRPPLQKHVAARRPSRGTSPSLSYQIDRRQNASGSSSQRGPSPSQTIPAHLHARNAHQPPPSSQGQHERHLRIEVETLKAQLDELMKAQEKTSTELEEARNARFAKEGEVSILRKSIEKTTKDHATELARLKSAQEQAVALQAQIRKEAREELERMKTEYLFKQHELETSARHKTPWTARARRTDSQVPYTPMSASMQRRQSMANGNTETPLRTPSRARIGTDMSVSPKRPHRKKIIHIPDSPPKRPVKLRGFVSAFEPTTPKSAVQFVAPPDPIQPSQTKRKGKERVDASYNFSATQKQDLFFNPPPSLQPMSPFERRLQDEVIVPQAEDEPQYGSSARSSSPDPLLTSSPPPAEMDVEMSDQHDPIEPVEVGEPLLGSDWCTRELQKIILAHRYEEAKQPTLHLLINHTLPNSAPPEQVQAYVTHSARVLEVLASASTKITDVNDTILSATQTLCAMATILCETSAVPLLTALINMLKLLALFIPPFVGLAISSFESANAPPEILMLLCQIIRGLLAPREGGFDDAQSALATETMDLLEAVTWHIPPDLAMCMAIFLRTADVLGVLINLEQPVWFLQRVLRALSLVVSYRGLHKHFLAFEISDDHVEGSAREYSRIPHVELLVSVLVDHRFEGPTGQPLRRSVLHFLGMLLVVHNDESCRTILLNSKTLLQSATYFLMQITAPLYEEDDEFFQNSELVDWTVDTMISALVLLYHLLKGTDFYSVRQKLAGTRGAFNGAWHMFAVSLGRIGYCPPPLRISNGNYKKLDDMSDTAREVLEWMTDGPELESIWEAFQMDATGPQGQKPVQEPEEEMME